MQIGSEYSTATPRMALIESSRPVCWISSSARLSQCARPAQMPTPSSSLQMRMSRGPAPAGERPQQAFAGGDVGNRDDELDAACLDFPENASAGESVHCPSFTLRRLPFHAPAGFGRRC